MDGYELFGKVREGSKREEMILKDQSGWGD
jgi:hypothetical protein